MKKIFPVFGEITKPNFDLSDEHLRRVMENAEIVFNIEPLLKMNANSNLKPNILVNLVGTKHAMVLANKIKNLIQFVHLSTVFCNEDVEVVDERVYDFEHNSKDLINISKWMSDLAIQALQNSVLGSHPNAYCYTMRLAEILINNEYESLPVSIVRPSFVSPFIEKMVPKWNVRNAAGKSILTNLLVNHKEMFEMISLDTLTNALILIAKDLSTRAKK
jgi:alcohol-forming fatty acyl-CoA reductase